MSLEIPKEYQSTFNRQIQTQLYNELRIIKGLDSEGNPLDIPMPVWEMSDEDLTDLFEFLKTLQ